MKKKDEIKEKNVDKVILKTDKIKKRKRRLKIMKISLFALLLFLVTVYLLLKIVYGSGNFTIKLDNELATDSGLVMYESLDTKLEKKILEASRLDFMDNISINWLPQNIDESNGGGHNGDNYIAYTFFVENRNVNTISYWYAVEIDDIVKNVDDAVRVMIILNGERTVYAKANRTTGEPEEDTKKFFSEDFVLVESRDNLNPEGVDKFTIVVWLEGDDPECVDDIIGGQIKMHMELYEEYRE